MLLLFVRVLCGTFVMQLLMSLTALSLVLISDVLILSYSYPVCHLSSSHLFICCCNLYVVLANKRHYYNAVYL